MDVLQAIRTKRAVRDFTDQPISPADQRIILDAGRRSQSSKNSQPWQFIAITNREVLRELAGTGTYAGHLAGAAFAVAVVSSVEWAFDVGQAAAYMQLAAWDLGIGSCIASIWEPERAKQILGIPDEYFFEVAISFGYPREALPRPQGVPAGRKPLQDLVHWNKW